MNEWLVFLDENDELGAARKKTSGVAVTIVAMAERARDPSYHSRADRGAQQRDPQAWGEARQDMGSREWSDSWSRGRRNWSGDGGRSGRGGRNSQTRPGDGSFGSARGRGYGRGGYEQETNVWSSNSSAWHEERTHGFKGETQSATSAHARVLQGGNREWGFLGEASYVRMDGVTASGRQGVLKEGLGGGGIQVTVSRGGGREVTLKGGGDGGSNCGSQSGTPRGRKENRGGQESLNWRGTSKSSSRRGRSNSKDRDDVSSLASNEDRPSFAAEMRREASSSSGGSRDGRSRGIGYGQRGNEKQFPGRAGEERGVGYGRGNWEGRWSDWSPRGSSYGSPRTPEVFKDQGRDGTIGRGERDFGDRRWRRGGMHNAYQGAGRQSDAYQNAEKYSVRSASEAATPSGSWKEDGRLATTNKLTEVLVHGLKDSGTVIKDARDTKSDEKGHVQATGFVPVGDSDEVALQTAADEDVSLAIIGTCADMCPAREREQRERLRDLAVFERVNGNISKTSAELAVKKFCRTFSSTSLHPSDVRPLPVLWRTQHYLLCMLDRRDYSFETVHAFLFDRTRAIRQELGMQSILNSQAICMLEEIVRFHIMSERELRERTAGAGREVDLHLNLQQLSKALLTLLTMYSTEYSINGRRCPTEAEFHCYYVLLNLGDHDHFKAEPLSLWFRGVHPSVLKSSVMHFARTVLRCYRNENYRGFFESVRKATYLQACLMELFFSQMRGIALKLLNQGGYKLHPYPMADIAKMLLMKETDADELCKSYGLETGIDKSTKALSLLAKQAQFTPPEKDVFRHQCSLINSKRAASYYQQVTETEVDQ